MFSRLRSISSLALAALPLLAFGASAQARAPLATIPIGRCDLHQWCARHQSVLAQERTANPDVVFLGDSITYNWLRDGPQPWAHYKPIWDRQFGQWHPLNLGFVGDTTSSILWRIDHGELDHIHPRVIVLLAGANNFGRVHWSAEDTEAGIATIIARIAAHQPQARILLLGVLPSDRGSWVEANTRILNAALQARYANAPKVVFMNVNDIFLKDGRIDTSAYYDPLLTPPAHALHPLPPYQEKIGARILPKLRLLVSGFPVPSQPAHAGSAPK